MLDGYDALAQKRLFGLVGAHCAEDLEALTQEFQSEFVSDASWGASVQFLRVSCACLGKGCEKLCNGK